MLIVGEKINTSRPEVSKAVKEKDISLIVNLAKRQAESGANYIDVNCGTFVQEEQRLLKWLVEEIQKEIKAPICIDSPSPLAVESALKLHRGQALVNSISGEKSRYEPITPLVVEYGCKIVVLCMDDTHGVPKTAEIRFGIASKVIEILVKKGISLDDIYIDPLIQPVSTNTINGKVALETILLVKKNYPGIHAICGLSNISFGLPSRKLLNQTFMVLCMAAGLDAVILNPEDRRMMSSIYGAEALLGFDSYCVKYLNSYRSGLLD